MRFLAFVPFFVTFFGIKKSKRCKVANFFYSHEISIVRYELLKKYNIFKQIL